MSKDTVTATQTEASNDRTKAEFLVALDEVNVTLAKQIEQVRQNQIEIRDNNEDLRTRIAETRAIVERL